MSQRDSGYERKERDLYETPAWVTEALLPHIQHIDGDIWEPAAGSGKMVRVLANHRMVWADDISEGRDFLEAKEIPAIGIGAIITNPPYALACEFIWQAICLMRVQKPDGNYTGGLVAMLLRTDFDHAKSRLHLFERAQFSKKVVLTKRIKWFEDSKGQPSFNHAWFIWDWRHSGPPTIAYGP